MPALWKGSYPPSVITSLGPYAVGGLLSGALTAPTAALWSVANSCLFMPLILPWPVVVKRMFWVNGGVGDTCDVGIMEADGTKIFSSGATAQSGANQPQFVTAGISLNPGFYYLAMADNNAATGTFHSASGTNNATVRAGGVLYQASSATVPSPATFAALATWSRVPLVGLEITRAL